MAGPSVRGAVVYRLVDRSKIGDIDAEQRQIVLAAAGQVGFDNAMHALTMAQSRVPARNLDAEASTLSALLLKPELLGHVAAWLKPTHFYSQANERIYQAILELADLGTPIDLTTVCDWLRERGWLLAVGGPSYLAQLADATPAVMHVAAHGRIVRKLAFRRRRQTLCHQMAAEAYGEVEDDWEQQCDRRWAELQEGDDDESRASLKSSLQGAFTKMRVAAERKGQITGLPTGLRELDQITGGSQSQEVTLICGATGGGKSALVGNMAVTVASEPELERWNDEDSIHHYWLKQWRTHGLRQQDGTLVRWTDQAPPRELWVPRGVLFFALEMPREDVAQRMACAQGRVNFKKIKNGQWEDDDWDRLAAAGSYLSELPLVIDDSPGLTILRLIATTQRTRDEFAAQGIRLRKVVIDYAQLMGGADVGVRDGDRRRELSEIGRRLKTFARSCKDVAFELLSQLNDDGRAFESKALEHHADNVWIVSREKEAEPGTWDGPSKPRRAKILVRKQRQGDDNVVANTWYHAAYTLFSDEEQPQ
jgi:replicative DNA helicase